MAGIVDTFLVELGMDSSGFSRGQREASQSLKKTGEEFEKRAKDMERRAQGAGDFFSKLRGQAIALYAAFTAGKGIREFVQDIIVTTANLGRMSRTMDISAQELSTWRGAATAMGGSADEVTGSIFGMSQSLQQFMLTGESSVIPYFRALGISISDVNGHLKTATQLYEEAGDKVQGMDPARATAILSGLGANQSMINFLLQSSKARREQLAEQKKYAATPQDVKAAQDLQRSWNEVELASTKAGRTILTMLAPALLKVLKYVKQFADYLAQHKAAAMGFFTGLTFAAGGLSIAMLKGTGTLKLLRFGFKAAAAPAMFLARTAFPLLTRAVIGFGAALFATPLGWILAGIVGLGIAGYELYKHWDEVKNWWHHLWGGMGDDAESGAYRIKKADDYCAGRKTSRPSEQSDLPLYKGPRQSISSTILKRALPNGGSSADTAAVKYFMGQGWSREQAAGIVAHLKYESGTRRNPGGLDPTEHTGDSGRAYGIAQWGPERQSNFSRRYGHDIRQSTLAEQLDFVNYELKHGSERHAGSILRSAQTIEQAIRAGFAYERPTDPNQSFDRRLNIGRSLLSSLSQNSSRHMAAANPALAIASRSVHNNSSNETHIGKITVHTQARDADAIARSLGPAIQNNSFASQANYGAA